MPGIGSLVRASSVGPRSRITRLFDPGLGLLAPDRGHPRVADLLRQTSGLPEYPGFEGVRAKNGRYRVNADYVTEFARRRDGSPALFPSGEGFRYTNSNYMLLAVVVERADGKPLGAFLRDDVFDPLGMDSTFVYDCPASVRQHPKLGRVSRATSTARRMSDGNPGGQGARYDVFDMPAVSALTTAPFAIWRRGVSLASPDFSARV
jgi:CubicO group peptidase (beta-lactamase class C family)